MEFILIAWNRVDHSGLLYSLLVLMKRVLHCSFSFFFYSQQLSVVLIQFFKRYHCDPSGTYVQYRAKAIGAASEGAQNALQEQYNNVRFFLSILHQFSDFLIFIFQSLTLAEAEVMALSILKQVMEEEIKPTNVEIASVSAATGKFQVYNAGRIQELIEVVNRKHEENEAAARAS